jgi:hypothetical protein
MSLATRCIVQLSSNADTIALSATRHVRSFTAVLGFTAQNATLLAVGSLRTLVNSIGFGISILSIQLFVMLARSVPLAALLPWLGLGPLLGVWALAPLWRR